MCSFVYSGSQFGSLAMLPIAGMLASSSGGWPVIFYVGGIVALIWVLLWLLFGYNSPAEHQSMSETEREFIISSLSLTTSKTVN